MAHNLFYPISSKPGRTTFLQDALYGDGLNPTTFGGLSSGALAGAALWSAAYWFCTPFQLLLLFLGRIDVERPSDWLMRQLGPLLRLPCAPP